MAQPDAADTCTVCMQPLTAAVVALPCGLRFHSGETEGCGDLTFDGVSAALGGHVTKNRDLFDARVEAQRRLADTLRRA